MTVLVCVCGVTCSGKDTLCEYAKAKGDGIIQVGKEMRKRHPPEFFKGLGAMEKTELEAWEIFMEQFKANYEKSLIFCSGQPRTINQVERILALAETTYISVAFVYLHASDDELVSRAIIRWKTEAEYKLFEARLKNDRIQGYDALSVLLNSALPVQNISFYDTEKLTTKMIYDTIISEQI